MPAASPSRRPPPGARDRSHQIRAAPDDDVLGFSIVSSRISLTVVGIVATEAVASGAPAFGRSGAYMPVAVAEELAVVQGNDMNEVIRNQRGGGRHYANLTVRVKRPTNVPAVEDAIRRWAIRLFPCSI